MRKRPSTTTSSPSSVEIAPERALVPSGPSNGTGKEPRNVVLSKLPSESYGLSLGTILFVKDLDYRGPAGRDGRLEPGDVILKVPVCKGLNLWFIHMFRHDVFFFLFSRELVS